jgi:nucleotide-binding universal stress UspA family protein
MLSNSKNRIIVLVDFSKYTDTLLSAAKEFQKNLDAELVFLHQLAKGAYVLADSDIKSKMSAIEKDEAFNKLKSITKDFDQQTCKHIITDDDLVVTINRLKQPQYQNWIFAGIKGAGLLKKIFIGSTITKVIDNSDITVIAFPVQQEFCLPQNLVIATTYKYPINTKELKTILEKLSDKVSLEFLSLIKPDDDETKAEAYFNELKQEFSSYPCEFHSFISLSALDDIKSFMSLRTNSYLVVQEGSRALSDNMLRQFLINELVYSNSIPLIVLPR